MGVDHDVIQGTAFQAYNYIWTIDDFFRVHIGVLGEFSTVMQTLSGLHNCLEFSQLPLVFRWGYVNTEKSPLLLL